VNPGLARRRSTVYRLLVAAAALGIVATAGCGSKDPAGASATPSGGTFAQVTRAEAEQHIAAYVDLNNRANAALEEKRLAEYEAQASLAIDEASYRAKRQGNVAATTSFIYMDTTLAIPRVEAYPRWFVLKGHQKKADGQVVQRWAYLLFRQEKAGGPWMQVTKAVGFDGDAAPEEIKTDGNEVATAAPIDASDLVVAPKDLGTRLVKRATGEENATEKAMFTQGDSWTKSITDLRLKMSRYAKVTYQAAPATQYTTYGVRTVDGGALVFTTILIKERYDVYKGSWVTDETGIGFLKKGVQYRTFLEKQHLSSLLVYIPPADVASGKLRVLGVYDGILAASGR
jgi:hypothetical protein